MKKQLLCVLVLGFCALSLPAQGIEGKKRFVAVGGPAGLGGDKTGMAGYSTDGKTWKTIDLEDLDEPLEQMYLSGVAYGNGVAVAVSGKQLVISRDLEDWRLADTQPNALDGGFYSVAWGNGMFVAVGGSSSVAFSTDGSNWKRLADKRGVGLELNSEMGYAKTHLYGVSFIDGKFYALGNGNAITVLVPKGDTLELESSTMKGLITSRLNEMAKGPDSYVVVGTMEDYRSVDLVKWSKVKPGVQYFGVVWGKDKYVAVSGFGGTHYSADGTSDSWKEAASGKIRGSAYTTVAWGNGLFVAGSKGTVSVSPDGVNWSQHTAPMRFAKIIYIP